jgi:uncharacterized protein YbjT (DUF2867 family)
LRKGTGKKYLLSGPENLKRIELARLIGEAIGREVSFEEQPHEEALAEMTQSMGDFASWYLDGMAQLVGYQMVPAPTVQAITGRPGMTFSQWATKYASHFR